MKRRIEQLLNGIFEYEPGHVVIRPEQLDLQVTPGALLHGKFFVEGADGQRVHGYLYPSDARMICEPSEFHGITNEIQYQFDCSGLQANLSSAASESDAQEELSRHQESDARTSASSEADSCEDALIRGSITVCCDCGEFEIPYIVHPDAHQIEERLPFSTLEEFTQLARTDYQRAYRYFLRSSFRTVLSDRPDFLALYEGLRLSDVSYRNMEEFLTAAGQKEELKLSAAATERPGETDARAESGYPKERPGETGARAESGYPKERPGETGARAESEDPRERLGETGARAQADQEPEVSSPAGEDFSDTKSGAPASLYGSFEQPCEALSLDYGELKEPVQETIQIRKNGWGFLTVSVESDAMFVRPERKLFSTDDFAGSTFDLNLVLDTNLMHAGNNYARLTIKAGRQTIQVSVTARKKAQWTKDRQAHIRKIMMKKLENLYVGFRLQKTDMPAWIEHSVSVINSYKRAGGDDPFADLFLVQMYYADGRKHKASRLLEQIEAQKERLDTPERYCYYLYITTFFYQEASYVDRVEEEVCRQFYRRQESWQLQWILLYLQEKYLSSPDARYEAVAEQFVSGCRSRILYLEAWQALKDNPFLLRHLGEFELHLLRFADQEKIMTAEILRQVANLAMHYTAFDRRLYQTLANGWKLYPSEDLVRAICLILIHGDKKEKEYFAWYERGVNAGLRLNGLYEAYLQTMEDMEFKDLPQIIRMYFTYDTSLDYTRRAALYRSIYEHRESEPQAWVSMRASMERFVVDQLEFGHITADLAVLYSGFLRESMITAPLAGKLIRLLFTYEIECSQSSLDIRQIVLHSVRAQQDYTAVLKNGRAQIRIYDPDAALIAVDADGGRREARSLCRIRRLFEDEKLLAWCAKKAPDYPGLVIFLCAQSLKSDLMNERLLPYFRAGCGLYEITDSFRDELRAQVLAWYMEHPRDDTLPEFLDWVLAGNSARRQSGQPAERASRRNADSEAESSARRQSGQPAERASRRNTDSDAESSTRRESISTAKNSSYRSSAQDFARVNKTAMITLLAEDGRCAEAFALLDTFGSEDIPLLKLVRITSRMVLELEFEENTMLLSLCHQCFTKGKYDDKLLRYLLLYYEGPVEEMKRLWNAACEFGLDTMLLEEKILMMILFTRTGTQSSEPIFEAYVKKLGRKRICRAYVNLKSYEYFVRGLPVAEPVFSFIEKDYRRLSGTDRLFEQEEVCRLALLEYYARAASLTKTQRIYAAEILEEFNTKGKRFAFYKRFDEKLLRPWQLEGHVFAEYVCNPKSTVSILYRYKSEESSETGEADYTRELVPDCFEGIFVKEFILFAGEELECVFEEKTGEGDSRDARVLRTDKWTLRADPDEPDTGMYGLLNRLCRATEEGNEEEAQEALDSWLTLEYLAKEVFTLV